MHFIVDAVLRDRYVLELKFRSGEVRLLDMNPYIQEGGVFGKLRDKSKFLEVEVQHDLGGLIWQSGADFCPNTAFMKSEPCAAKISARKHKDKPI